MRIEVCLKYNSFWRFDNIDKVKDGTESLSESNGTPKLVLLRKKNNARAYEFDTVAVFNHWHFWKVIDDEKCASADDKPIMINEATKTLNLVIKKVEYNPSYCGYIFTLNGDYTMVVSDEFIKDFLSMKPM